MGCFPRRKSNRVGRGSILPTAEHIIRVHIKSDGWVNHIDAEVIGVAAMMLGAGRMTKETVIDMAISIKICV